MEKVEEGDGFDADLGDSLLDSVKVTIPEEAFLGTVHAPTSPEKSAAP